MLVVILIIEIIKEDNMKKDQHLIIHQVFNRLAEREIKDLPLRERDQTVIKREVEAEVVILLLPLIIEEALTIIDSIIIAKVIKVAEITETTEIE